MTREDIIRMAQEARCDIAWANSLERFAALVAKHEREACAKVCECFNSEPVSHATVAAEIRKRGDEK